jgi:hypothetical protein
MNWTWYGLDPISIIMLWVFGISIALVIVALAIKGPPRQLRTLRKHWLGWRIKTWEEDLAGQVEHVKSYRADIDRLIKELEDNE